MKKLNAKSIILSHFDGLCILTSFTLLTITVQGVSNKHCLLSFFIDPIFILAGKEDNHKILYKFDFRPDVTTDWGVGCP